MKWDSLKRLFEVVTTWEEITKEMAITQEPSRLTVQDLVRYFYTPLHYPKSEKIGVELEKFLLFAKTGQALPLIGPKSIQRILTELAHRYYWEPEYSQNMIINLRKEGRLLSVEPGGQLEFSSVPHEFVDQAKLQEEQHLKELYSVIQDWDVIVSGLSMQPVSSVHQVEWLLKERYQVMREYLLNRDTLGHWMMKMTTSTQVSIDYLSEDDAREKMAALAAVMPVLSAMFSNSCLTEGKLNGYQSYRTHIWQHTDPDRCGLPVFYFNGNFSFENYVQYALDIPIYFLKKADRFIAPIHKTFRQYLKDGFENYRATLQDWEMHLSCLFPDIRLKNYLEIRAFDRNSGLMAYAAPTLVKLLSYNREALVGIRKLMEPFTVEMIRDSITAVSEKGLRAQMGKYVVLDLAKEVLKIAQASLQEALQHEKSTIFERDTFDFLQHLIVDRESTPADLIIHRMEQGDSILKIIRDSALTS